MKELHSSQNHISQNQSKNVKNSQPVVKNKRNGDFDSNYTSDGVFNDYKGDTLDPVAAGDDLQHSLRSLLRQKYRQGGQRRTSSANSMKMTDFGLIDSPLEEMISPLPPEMIAQPTHEMIDQQPPDNFFASKRLPVIDTPEIGPSYSLNCFGFSNGIKQKEKEDSSPVSLPFQPSNPLSIGSTHLVRGVMWLQRERMFSRWKERFIIMTQEYLQCYRRGTTLATEMGPFLFQIRLSEVQSLQLVDRRGYLTVLLGVQGDDNILIRRAENVREWYNLLQRMVKESKTREKKLTRQVWEKKAAINSENIEEWLAARERVATRYQYSHEKQAGAFSMDRLDRKYSINNNERLPELTVPHTKVHMRSKSADRRICQKTRRPRSGEISMRNDVNFVMSEDSGNSSLNNSTIESEQGGISTEFWVRDPS